MNHLKRILAMLLVAAMLIQVLPASVFADEPETTTTPLQESIDYPEESPVYENAAPTISGAACGSGFEKIST